MIDSKILRSIKGFPKYIFMIFYALFSIYPLYWMMTNSFKNNEEIFSTNSFGLPSKINFENYKTVFTTFNIMSFLKNSLIIAVVVVLATILLSLMFAYATARMKWKLSKLAMGYMTSGMFIPVVIVLIPLIILVRDMHLQQSYLSLILPYVAFNLSFSSLIFFGFLRGLPFELEEAAAIDGASIYRTFFQIIIPMVLPAVSTMLIFIFLFSWNEFPIALIMTASDKIRTLPLGIIFLQGRFIADWGAMAALLTVASIPVMVIYLLFSEQIEKAMTVGSAIKG